MEIEKRILETLNKNREGLTISELSKKLKLHRHTTPKYLYKLEAQKKIKIRKVGVAKLCYLKKRK